jgi:hypothetical protein
VEVAAKHSKFSHNKKYCGIKILYSLYKCVLYILIQ